MIAPMDLFAGATIKVVALQVRRNNSASLVEASQSVVIVSGRNWLAQLGLAQFESAQKSPAEPSGVSTNSNAELALQPLEARGEVSAPLGE